MIINIWFPLFHIWILVDQQMSPNQTMHCPSTANLHQQSNPYTAELLRWLLCPEWHFDKEQPRLSWLSFIMQATLTNRIMRERGLKQPPFKLPSWLLFIPKHPLASAKVAEYFRRENGNNSGNLTDTPTSLALAWLFTSALSAAPNSSVLTASLVTLAAMTLLALSA